MISTSSLTVLRFLHQANLSLPDYTSLRHRIDTEDTTFYSRREQ
jgi:hypothetical protein